MDLKLFLKIKSKGAQGRNGVGPVRLEAEQGGEDAVTEAGAWGEACL